MGILLAARPYLFLVGLVLFFVTQRYLSFESYYMGLLIGVSVFLVLCCLLPVLGFMRARSDAKHQEAKSWLYVGAWMVATVVGLGLYYVYAQKIGTAASPNTLLTKALLAGWLITLIVTFFAAVGLELSHAKNGVGPHADAARVVRAGVSWGMVGVLLCALVAVNYGANKKDKTYDWSYLKTTTPGSATQNLVKSFEEPVDVAVFYPHDNEVKPYVAEYFDFLKEGHPQLNLAYYDVALHPGKAEEFKVSRNGQVVFRRDGKRERFDVGLKMRSAKGTLKKFDAEVQKALLRLTQEKRTLYFTRGHGESSWLGKKQPFSSIKLLETHLRSQNYSLRQFGKADGSATKIPDDAAAIVIVGPTSPFSKEEVSLLRDYLKSGGRLMVYLDVAKFDPKTPDFIAGGPDPLIELLAEAGLKYQRKMLANDRQFYAATRSKVDRWFIFSNTFTSHESVASLARHEERVAILAFQSGYFDVTPKLGDWKAFTTVRALSDTFVDLNRDYAFNAGQEKRNTYSLGAVAVLDNNAQRKSEDDKDLAAGRVVAFADATALSDMMIRNPANAIYATDAIKWLIGQTANLGEVASEEDVKIRHTRKEDTIWFNLTVFGMPSLILLAGFIATRRKVRKA